ncbi:MAG: carbohydrate kinase family protein [Anaerolineae bacterium]
MNGRSLQVLCVGLMVADVVVSPVTTDCFSRDTNRLERALLRGGGDALNEATVLSRLGVRTALVGRVGHDLFGTFLLQHLGEAGVATEYVQRDDALGTAVTIVLLQKTGERNFLYYPGAGARLRSEDVSDGLLSQCEFLAVGSAFGLPGLDGYGLADMLARAQRARVRTVLDTTWDGSGRWLERLAPALKHVDYFVPSLYEGQAIVGNGPPQTIAERLAALGPPTIVLKLGADGCYLYGPDDRGLLPPLPSRVVDTTGAGDCFVAGLLAGLVRGWSLRQSAFLGHAAAACCVEAVGATAGVRDWEQVSARLP